MLPKCNQCFISPIQIFKYLKKKKNIIKTSNLSQEHANVTFQNFYVLFPLVSLQHTRISSSGNSNVSSPLTENPQQIATLSLLFYIHVRENIVCILLRTSTQRAIFIPGFFIWLRFKTKNRFVVNS